MSVIFRFARADELEEIVRLTGHSFPGAGRDREWWMARYRETVYGDGPEIIWVGEEGGRLIASCQLHRITHWVSGSEFPAMGLGTVAIAPTHRQRGLAGQMVSTALGAARERGDLLSSLYPFRAAFYGRYGYGLCGESHQYHLAPANLPDSDARSGVELLHGKEDLAEAAALYERWASSQTGQVKRSSRAWEELAGGVDRLLVGHRTTDGRLAGYVLATYQTHLPAHERYLSVEEHVWETTEARRGLYGWLSSLGDQWRGIALRALPEHRLEDWISEPRLAGDPLPRWGLWFPSAVLLRGPMFRLVDLRESWARRAVPADAALSVALEVRDGQVRENAGSWRLRIESGGVQAERGDAPADLRLEIDIQTLSRIFMGALPASAAVEAGLARANRPERLPELDLALRLPTCWTFDRY